MKTWLQVCVPVCVCVVVCLFELFACLFDCSFACSLAFALRGGGQKETRSTHGICHRLPLSTFAHSGLLPLVFLSAQSSGFEALEHLFDTICSLMSVQLRTCIRESLTDYVQLFETYAEPNRYDGEYTDANVTARPLLRVELVVEEDDIIIEPSLGHVGEVLSSACVSIAKVRPLSLFVCQRLPLVAFLKENLLGPAPVCVCECTCVCVCDLLNQRRATCPHPLARCCCCCCCCCCSKGCAERAACGDVYLPRV